MQLYGLYRLTQRNFSMKILETLKEIRLFILLIISLGGTSFLNWDNTMEAVYTYNIHLGVITILGIYATNFLSVKRHNCMEQKIRVQADAHTQLQTQVKEIILDSAKSQLRAEARQAFKDYHDIETIDFVTTIRYLKALEERRIALGINSYTEDMMTELLSKIKL